MQLIELIENAVSGLGYELVDLETSPRGRLLRVFIDRLPNRGTVTIDDCTAVSNQLTRLLTVENVDYDRLEVSSPGLDRVLKKPADWLRFAGQDAQFKLRVAIGNQRNFVGVDRWRGAQVPARRDRQGPAGAKVLINAGGLKR